MKPNILFVCRNFPGVPDCGAAQRSDILYQALAKIFNVDTVLLSDSDDPSTELMNKYRVKKIIKPALVSKHHEYLNGSWLKRTVYRLFNFIVFPGGLRVDKRIAHIFGLFLIDKNYDLIVCRYLATYVQCGLVGLPNIIVDVDDLPQSVYATTKVVKAKNKVSKALLTYKLNRISNRVDFLISQCKHVWIPNPDLLHYHNATCLPNIPYPFRKKNSGFKAEENHSTNTILFVGLMAYAPNIEAMDYFIYEIWPQIISVSENANLRIVGRGLPSAKKAAWSCIEGVDIAGYIEDIDLEYQSCSVVVAPVLSGGGTNIKVLEAMLYGKPCVVSGFAANGFESIINNGKNIIVANTPREYGTQILDLLANEDKRLRIGNEACKSVQEKYGFNLIKSIVRQDICKAL